MAEPRVYEVTENIRVISTAHVRARSKAEAVAIVESGKVEMIHSEGWPMGPLHARLLRGEEAQYCDPGEPSDVR